MRVLASFDATGGWWYNGCAKDRDAFHSIAGFGKLAPLLFPRKALMKPGFMKRRCGDENIGDFHVQESSD